jgi:hypothetical protein
MALAVHETMYVHPVDVAGAFPYGDLEKELYMSRPPGFDDSAPRLCLQVEEKPLWTETITTHLASAFMLVLALLRFQPVSHTECVVERRDNGICVRMLAYGDDVLIISYSVL